jgi:4-hydroxy-tetrahydrodipicolinate reductase
MAARKGPIKVLHYGLGPIGAAVVKQVAARRGFKIVGAVDIDPAKVGRDLGEVAGVGRALKIKVSADAKKTIKATKPDVVVLCTLSSLKR